MSDDILSLIETSVQATSPELDSLPETLTQQQGQAYLLEFESQVMAGSEQRKKGEIRMKYALHMICRNELWRFGHDDTGNPFARQNDYLRHLADRIRTSRATFFNHRRQISIAVGGMGYELDDLERLGTTPFNVAKDYIEYDSKTGEILDIPGVDIPKNVTPGQYMRSIIDDVASKSGDELDLKPRDVRKAIEARLGIEEIDIYFWAEVMPNGGIQIGFVYDDPAGNMKNQSLAAGAPPTLVIEKLLKRLRISDLS